MVEEVVTVGTTPTSIKPKVPGCLNFSVKNNGAATVYLGRNMNVLNTANGWPITAGEVQTFTFADFDDTVSEWFGIVAAATVELRVTY